MKNIKSTNLIILFFLIFLSLILSFYIAFNFPIIETQPVYYEIAKSLMNSDYIIDNEKHVKNFYTFGYPAFISGYFFNNIDLTIRIVQLFSLITIWVIILYNFYLSKNYKLLLNNHFLDKNIIWGFFWLFFLLLHPYYHLNLTRVTDTTLATLCITILYSLVVIKFKSNNFYLVLAGIVLGLFIGIRPNSIILIFFFIYFFYKNPINKFQYFIFITTTFLTYIIFSKIITGKLLFWPSQGGYTFYAGNNPFSFEATKNFYNSERSLGDGISWCGLAAKSSYTISTIEYVNCSFKFLFNDFIGFCKNFIFKIYNLFFRPNLNLESLNSSEGINLGNIEIFFKILIVIPAYIWWLTFVFNKKFRNSFSVKYGALFIFTYCSISIITLTDPRHSLPIDIIYIISSLNYRFGLSNK